MNWGSMGIVDYPVYHIHGEKTTLEMTPCLVTAWWSKIETPHQKNVVLMAIQMGISHLIPHLIDDFPINTINSMGSNGGRTW